MEDESGDRWVEAELYNVFKTSTENLGAISMPYVYKDSDSIGAIMLEPNFAELEKRAKLGKLMLAGVFEGVTTSSVLDCVEKHARTLGDIFALVEIDRKTNEILKVTGAAVVREFKNGRAGVVDIVANPNAISRVENINER